MKNYRKVIVAIAAAAGVAISTSVDNHVDANDIIAIALAVLGSLGVYVAPNDPTD